MPIEYFGLHYAYRILCYVYRIPRFALCLSNTNDAANCIRFRKLLCQHPGQMIGTIINIWYLPCNLNVFIYLLRLSIQMSTKVSGVASIAEIRLSRYPTLYTHFLRLFLIYLFLLDILSICCLTFLDIEQNESMHCWYRSQHTWLLYP